MSSKSYLYSLSAESTNPCPNGWAAIEAALVNDELWACHVKLQRPARQVLDRQGTELTGKQKESKRKKKK